jgi:hypothetical protein
MIKLSYKILNSNEFNKALYSLSAQNGFANFQEAYNMTKIVRQFQSEQKIAHELFQTLAKEYCEVDEKGDFVKGEKPHPICPWKIKEGKETEFEAKLEDFLNTEVSLAANPVKTESLTKVALSPNQIITLEPIFAASEPQPVPSQH